MSEELEKLRHKQYVAERKLTAAKHKEKRWCRQDLCAKLFAGSG